MPYVVEELGDVHAVVNPNYVRPTTPTEHASATTPTASNAPAVVGTPAGAPVPSAPARWLVPAALAVGAGLIAFVVFKRRR